MVANLVLPQPTDLGDEWGNTLNAGIMGVNSDVETLKGRLITAGEGLLGGGDLTQNRSLAIDFANDGQVSGTKAVRANDSRLADARVPVAHTHDYAPSGHVHDWASITSKPATFAPSAHSHPIGDVTNLQTSLDAKVATTRSVIAGSGLTGGGTLAADRTLAVDLATVAPLASAAAAAVGTSTKSARQDHVHPVRASDVAVPRDPNIADYGNGQRVYLRDGQATLMFEATASINWNSSWPVGTVPVGYRPVRAVWVVGINVSTGAKLSVIVAPDGTIKVAEALGGGQTFLLSASYPVA